MSKTTATPEESNPEISAEELAKLNLIEVAEETMLGDLMSLCIQEIKLLPRTWAYMGEKEQDEVIGRAENACRTAIKKAISIIASRNHDAVLARVDYVKFKDGEATAVFKGFGEGFHALADTKDAVLIVIPEIEPSLEHAPDVKPDKDQRELPLDKAA